MEGRVYIGLRIQRIRVRYIFWLLVMSEVTVANESPAVSQYSQKCFVRLWFQSLRVLYNGKAWQPSIRQGGRSRSWEFPSLTASTKQKENQKQGEDVHSDIFTPSSLHYQTSSNSTTSWGPSIQMSESKGGGHFLLK